MHALYFVGRHSFLGWNLSVDLAGRGRSLREFYRFDVPGMGNEDFQNPFLFLWQKKKRFLHAKEKEALMALLGSARKRHGGVRLYAHGVDRPRPLRPAPVEQGKAVVLSLSRLVFGPSAAWSYAGINGRRYGLIRRKCFAVGPRVPLLRRRTCAPCAGGVTT